MNDMFGRERIRDTGLAEVVADGNLTTPRIAAADDVELVEVVGIALHQHGHIEAGKLEGVRHALFVAEIREDHEHAGNPVAVATKEIGTFPGVIVRLDAAELGLGRVEHDGLETQLIEKLGDVGAGLGHELVGKEVPVAKDDTKGGGRVFHGENRTTGPGLVGVKTDNERPLVGRTKEGLARGKIDLSRDYMLFSSPILPYLRLLPTGF